MTDAQLNCALDLMRRLPPTDVQDNLAGLVDLVPDLTEDLLSSVDQPLEINICAQTGREYLACDFNRDGDSYRSPWSNEFDPPLDDGVLPSDDLRQMEIAANDIFNHYREMYYAGGVSSAYFWDLDEGFAACILIKKTGDAPARNLKEGTWDSIHVIEVTENSRGDSAHYKLTTTIILGMAVEGAKSGVLNLSGNLTRQVEEDRQLSKQNSHLVNIGIMVEDMELKLRNTLDLIYFGKTKDILGQMRKTTSMAQFNNQRSLQQAIMEGMQEKRKG